MFCKVRTAENLDADASTPVVPPFAEFDSRPAPHTLNVEAVTIVNAALFAELVMDADAVLEPPAATAAASTKAWPVDSE